MVGGTLCLTPKFSIPLWAVSSAAQNTAQGVLNTQLEENQGEIKGWCFPAAFQCMILAHFFLVRS